MADQATADPVTSYISRVLGYGQRALEYVVTGGFFTDLATAKNVFGTPRVAQAARLWKGLPTDQADQDVLIGDLQRFCQEVSQRMPGRKAVIQLKDMGFQAWTMSSRLVLVDPSFDPMPDTIKRVLLLHEARHVRQFRGNGDRPPNSYLDMVRFEARAYAETLTELQALSPEPNRDAFIQFLAVTIDKVSFPQSEGLVEDLGKQAELTNLKDTAHRDWFVARSLLPPTAGVKPQSLYVT